MKKILLCICFAFCVFAYSVYAQQESAFEKISFSPAENLNIEIFPVEKNGIQYVVLPSFASANDIILNFSVTDAVVTLQNGKELLSGQSLDLTALCEQSNPFKLGLTVSGIDFQQSLSFDIYISQNVPAMFLLSENPTQQGREWVESSFDKSNKAKGNMLLVDKDACVIYDGALTQIKGRGNSTWAGDKKPYQIKLEQKADLLCTGNDANKSKTWVLLASYYDITLMRNKFIYDLAYEMGMHSTPECYSVDLYYDGCYRGTYLLSEKVEIGSGRVNITDLEKLNEQSNEDISDFGDLTLKKDKTSNGATYTYCEGMKNPDDISGGYLLEEDHASRAVEEICYFYTSREKYVVVKSPEYASKEQMDYIATLYQELEDTIYNGGVNSNTGKTLEQYVDLNSLARCYLINEFTKNPDGFQTSSYLHKDKNSDIFTLGPVWDYDLSLGVARIEEHKPSETAKGWYTILIDRQRMLYEYEPFRDEVNKEFYDNMLPLLRKKISGQNESTSFDFYKDKTAATAACNYLIWDFEKLSDKGGTLENNIKHLEDFIVTRTEWLCENVKLLFGETKAQLESFVDVPRDAWYYNAVMNALEKGYFDGYGNASFFPDNYITKAQLIKVLYSMQQAQQNGSDTSVQTQISFTDVKPTDWYSTQVLWAAANNIAKGYDDGTFRPDDPLTRQDAILMLYRFFKNPRVYNNNLTKYTDFKEISFYAYNAFCWAVENGIVKGFEDNTLRPEDNITRAQICYMLLSLSE